VRAGLPAERLQAVGYGQTLPVASNDTAQGRAQNRRIEFTVR
jgi:OOP family OmpA-OmpF porin